MITEEIWKDIPGYEGIYQASTLGRFKSLGKKVWVRPGKKYPDGNFIHWKGRILKSRIINGYRFVRLNMHTKKCSILLAMTFLNYTPNSNRVVIDHINNIRNDDRIENIQIITQRENVCKDLPPGTSKYNGVCWDKTNKKWIVRAWINNKRVHLGRFSNEYEAHLSYETALNKAKKKGII